ncbi:O-antigen ligase C-terminal domain-containing protein [Acinetobacter indicus]|uniref:PglL family O-oligosaccharyltransferase n=1 Tax=Acinetobacter indicus TaxID=756892 RepID=UPI002578B347|nr:O-antigen ligase family protein [Acinetobacter indicus]MDM1310855.1 O-antigen ligase C-terminal domain-containing protein [Acinetobacter indicus]
MKKILLFLILLSTCLSWINPFHYGIWRTAHSEFFIFFSLILLFIYTLINNQKLILNRSDLFFILISIIPIIQYLLGKIFFFGDAFIVSLYLLGFFIALTVGRNLTLSDKLNEKSFIFFSGVIIFSALISFYTQLNQWLMLGKYIVFIAEMPPGGRPFANFAQPNTLATFYLIAIFSSIYLYEKSRITKTTISILLVLLIFGITLTQSRTPWIFLSCFILWWFFKGRSMESSKLSTYHIMGFGSVFILFTFLVPYLSEVLFLSVQSLEQRMTGGMIRLSLWKQMLIAISNEPLWGYGWQQVSNAQIMTTLKYPISMWTEHSHNILIDLLVWNGIPLGVAIIIVICIWLKSFISPVIKIENFWFLSAVGAVIVHSMFEYPLEYAFLLLPVGFLLGLMQGENNRVSLISLSFSKAIIICILGISTFIIVFIDYSKLEKDMMLARFEVLNIGDLHANHKTPDVFLLTQLQAKIALMRTLPTENMSQVEQNQIYNTTLRYATQGALIKYAQVLALNGNKKKAQDQIYIINKLYKINLDYDLLLQLYSDKSLAYEWQNKEKFK